MRLLCIGDVVARGGRTALARALPAWRERYVPDAVVACVDNLAHGKSATPKTMDELLVLGVNVLTSGDHMLNAPNAGELLTDPRYPVVRPCNCPPGTPGVGWRRVELEQGTLLVIHVAGQVFMPEHQGFTSPFEAVERALKEGLSAGPAVTIVDIHAEATSEKVALGWFLDGRVAAVVGTHTHIPTSDEWIMPKGTAYVTDLGMTGIRESVLGVRTDIILRRFTEGAKEAFEPAETGTGVVTGVLIDADTPTKATRVERLTEYVTIG